MTKGGLSPRVRLPTLPFALVGPMFAAYPAPGSSRASRSSRVIPGIPRFPRFPGHPVIPSSRHPGPVIPSSRGISSMPWVKTDVGGVVGFHVKSSFWAGVPCQIFRLGGGTMSNLRFRRGYHYLGNAQMFLTNCLLEGDD